MQRYKHVFTRSRGFAENGHAHEYKAPKTSPAAFTLFDIIELYVQARVPQIIESAIPDFVFQPARGTENPFDTRQV